MSRSWFAPIPGTPSVNEPAVDRRLKGIPYPRATLSSFAFNLFGILMFLPVGAKVHTVDTAAPYICAALLHAMGVLSFVNWYLRVEWARLLDISCMLALKLFFIAIAIGLEKNNTAMIQFMGVGTFACVFLVCWLRIADGGADKVMAPVIFAFLACDYVYRPAIILEPLEGIGIFVLGYLCKLADSLHLMPKFWWFTTLFHVFVAYSIGLAGIGLRGLDAGDYIPRLHWVTGGAFSFAPSVVPPLTEMAPNNLMSWIAGRTGRQEQIISHFKARWHASEWPFHVITPYPMGYVQIEDHEPWSWEALLFVCGVALSLLVTRAIYQLLAPIVGKRLGVWLHGPEWLTKGHGGTLDWRRFADVCFFSTQHICLTTYASTALGGEIRSWLDDPSTSWFAFFQPALSDPLRAYYLFQLGVALEASLTMARSVAKGRTKDWPMVVHHAATLFVIIFANRLGFLRVGVFVVALHDATDIPIDGISISQALELKNGRVVSAIAGAASWAYLRGWVFARHVIGVIAFETGHIWRAYSVKHEGFVGDLTLIAGYSIFLVPLVLLWLLSCYEWLPKLTKKIVSSVTGSSKFADQLVDLATVGGMLCVAVSTLSNYLPSAALAHPEPFAQERVALLKTRECLYHNLTTVWDASALELLKPVIAPECDAPLYTGRGAVSCDAAFDGGEWSRWSQSNWHLPLLSVLAYLIAIPTLTRLMAPRQPMKIRAVVALWNFGLALFSIIGVSHVVPELLAGGDGLLTRGYYASVCRHASSYGCGDVGLWVLLFILSKFAELFDTMFLVLRKNAVIPLHWYHHATVLLYCWHSYASRIGTGLWFASMNYCVHSIMYFYFGLTQCGPRAKAVAKRFSMLITLLQLSQMVVGIVVTISSIVYHAHGATCYVSLLNSILGLAMYTSYFILFFALFQTLYLTKKNKNREAERKNPPPHPPQKPTTSEALEGWAVGKGKEIELVAETGSEAFLDLCSAGQREADVESKKSR